MKKIREVPIHGYPIYRKLRNTKLKAIEVHVPKNRLMFRQYSRISFGDVGHSPMSDLMPNFWLPFLCPIPTSKPSGCRGLFDSVSPLS